MNAMSVFEPVLEEEQYDEFFEVDECFTCPTATMIAGRPLKWISAVVISGALLTQPKDSERSFTSPPTNYHASFDDEFGTGETSAVCVPFPAESIPSILSEKDRLLEVKHFLALSTTELASLLGVSRQTIYAWIQGETDIRASNLSRLNVLHSLARQCHSALGKPLHRSMLKADIEGNSLLSILSEETINESLATKHLDGLIARATSDSKSTDTLSERSRDLGFKPMPEWMQVDSIAAATDQLSREG